MNDNIIERFWEIRMQRIIYSLSKYKSLEAEYAVFALNYSETRVRARRARTRTELVYRKYRREKSSANALGDRITARFTRYWSSEGLFQLSAKIDHWANKTEMEKRHNLPAICRITLSRSNCCIFRYQISNHVHVLIPLSLMIATSGKISVAIDKNYIKVLRIVCIQHFVQCFVKLIWHLKSIFVWKYVCLWKKRSRLWKIFQRRFFLGKTLTKWSILKNFSY